MPRHASMRTALALAVATVAVGAGAAATPARAAEPSNEELLEEVRALRKEVERMKQLEAKVAELEASQPATTTTAPASDDVARTVDAIVADAQQRSFLLQNSLTSTNWQAGKFTLRSDDGNFLLHPWFQLQFRNVTSYREGADGGADDEWDNGFEVRRMKFGVDGNVFSPDTTYLFLWATNRNNGNLQLEEAWLRHKFTDAWAVKAGQLKDPLARESLVSSKKQMTADRSMLTNLFTGGDNFVQGVSAAYTRDELQAEFAFHDGTNAANENFQDFPENSWDYGVAARVQYKLFGDWSAYEQFTSLGIKRDLAVVGAGADLSAAGDTNQFLHTLDAQYNQPSGLGLFAAYYGRFTANAPVEAGAPATPTDDTYDWGFIAQASYLVPDSKWEPFVRYVFIRFDDATLGPGAQETVHEITAGTNYYIRGHDLKLTVDVMFLPNGTPVSDTGSGVLASEDAQFVLRGQFQLLL